VFALVAWLAFSTFTGISAGLSAHRIETREIRAQCSTSGRVAGGPGCELGSGAVIMTNTYDHTRTIAAMDQSAAWSLRLASVFTAGAFCVAVFSIFGGSRREARQRRRYVGAAVDHVGREHRRAKSDVAQAKARLGKVGERRRGQWAKRWSREAAAGEVYSEPGRVDRWLLRQTKPPKTRVAKKADRASKKIGKADKRRQAVELDAEWKVELGAPVERPSLLKPDDGPPLSPVQRAEYAERLEMSDRERLAADTAALFEGSAR
jgi:hypothetical protein